MRAITTVREVCGCSLRELGAPGESGRSCKILICLAQRILRLMFTKWKMRIRLVKKRALEHLRGYFRVVAAARELRASRSSLSYAAKLRASALRQGFR